LTVFNGILNPVLLNVFVGLTVHFSAVMIGRF
jgi:hypothetical protein